MAILVAQLYIPQLPNDNQKVKSTIISVNGAEWTSRHQQSWLWLTTASPDLLFSVPFSAHYLLYPGSNAQTAWIGMKEIDVFAL